MSKEENQESHKPVKRASERTAPTQQPAPKRRGFLASVFSHLAVAAIAVIGVGSYIHWNDILNYTGSRVCAYNVLGQYAQGSIKVPPIDLKKSQSKPESQATPNNSAEKPEVKLEDKPAVKPQAKAVPQAPASSEMNSQSEPRPKPEQAAPAKVTEMKAAPQAEVVVKGAEKTDVTPDQNPVEESAQTGKKGRPSETQKQTESEPAISKQQTRSESFTQALQAARKQFWQNDKAAVKSYEALVQRQPGNAQLIDEMANVYYKNGETEKAINAFYAAGEKYIGDKNIEKAREISAILKRISPEKSAEFSKLLKSATN